MTKPKKRKVELPKTTQEWEVLTSDEVMQHIFGPEAQQALKQQAVTNDEPTANKVHTS